MDKEKKESAVRTAESFVMKSEIEKAFILGYMLKRMQIKELDAIGMSAPELAVK